MTLKYDGTTKNGYYIMELEVETKENTYFVGSPETIGGKATDYVDTIVTVLGKVDPHKLQDKVSNTMTDRVVTNTAVDRALEQVMGES